MSRPKKYPYTKNQWEKEETIIYYAGDIPYMKLTKEVNKITSETR